MNDVLDELKRLKEELERQSDRFIGYLINLDYDYSELYRFFKYSINNPEDPFTESFVNKW